jgi:hypothetical protein
MLYTPNSTKTSKRGLYGVVTSRGPTGPWMRRLSFPVQTNTPSSVLWRHIFLTAKQNWLSLFTAGAPVPGFPLVSTAGAWDLINGFYYGILQTGPLENNIQGMGTLISCTDGEAYYQMVQANAASMGLNPIATPGLVSVGGNPTPAAPPPVFAFPKTMGCSTLYDLSYNVTGFQLTYTWSGSWTYPASPWSWTSSGWGPATGGDAPGLWEIYASASYTDSYSPPDASTWQPILFSGPNIPLAADVLAAWIANYGDLPASGSIKFAMCYVDPTTCASGPLLSATASWKQGTLKGMPLAEWTGPIFEFNATPGSGTVTAPGSDDFPFSLVGSNGYGGTITPSLKGMLIIFDGMNNVTKRLPAGVTVTFSPPTITIPPGSTTPVSCTMTVTAASGCQGYSMSYDGGGGSAGQTARVSCTDGISTASYPITLDIEGDVVFILQQNYLTIGPSTNTPNPPSPGQAVVLITLLNTGPDEIDGEMLASCTNATIGLEFGQFAASAATATATTITFALPNSAGLNGLMGLTLSSAGYAPAGYNVTDATIIASDNTSATIEVSTNPGAMTTEGQAGLPGVAFTVPPGTLDTPGSYYIGLILTIPGSLDTLGIQIQVEAYAGNNTTEYTLTLVSP